MMWKHPLWLRGSIRTIDDRGYRRGTLIFFRATLILLTTNWNTALTRNNTFLHSANDFIPHAITLLTRITRWNCLTIQKLFSIHVTAWWRFRLPDISRQCCCRSLSWGKICKDSYNMADVDLQQSYLDGQQEPGERIGRHPLTFKAYSWTIQDDAFRMQ